MQIFGLSITRTKAAVPANLQSVGDRGNWWWPIVREPFTGAWQRNQEMRVDSLLTYSPLFRCVSLLAGDVAKNRLLLVEENDGLWKETSSPAFSPVLTTPNHYQNRIQFFTNWMESKLLHGNTFILKGRDRRGIVVALYVLDPTRVKVLVTGDEELPNGEFTPTGDVYYQLGKDNLAGVGGNGVIVPASEIIHDRWNTLFHPLVGMSPLYASGQDAARGLAISQGSRSFFQNGSRPGGILTAPAHIEDDTAKRLKDHWDQNYSGENAGKVAVLGDGLKYEAMSFKASDSQLVEQGAASAASVCTAFGVPAYKIGVGPLPTYNNIEALTLQYYSDALQIHIESIELLLDEGLGLNKVEGKTYGTEFDLDNLLRMDTATLIKAEADAVGAGVKTPNEARRRLGLGPKRGGDTPYLQEQNYSLAALDKRDTQPDPFAKPEPAAPPSSPAADASEDEEDEDTAKLFVSALTTKFADAALAA